MKRTHILTAIALPAMVAAISAFGLMSCKADPKTGYQKTGEQSGPNTMNREMDAKFLATAAEINLEEIALGQLAQKKSANPAVKALGKMMEDEHTKSLADLKGLAANKSITIPNDRTDKIERAYNDLNWKSEADFNKAYSQLMVDGHKNAISVFEKASMECADADIKQWATSTLPALRAHHNMAMSAQDKVR